MFISWQLNSCSQQCLFILNHYLQIFHYFYLISNPQRPQLQYLNLNHFNFETLVQMLLQHMIICFELQVEIYFLSFPLVFYFLPQQTKMILYCLFFQSQAQAVSVLSVVGRLKEAYNLSFKLITQLALFYSLFVSFFTANLLFLAVFLLG